MLKRGLILPFLLLAYTVVLAHSIVPHQHHHELKTETHDHDDDREEHDDIDDNFLSKPFSHFRHDTGNNDVTFIAVHSIFDNYKNGFYKEFIPTVDFISIKIELHFLERTFPPENVITVFSLAATHALLRGPPFFLD